MSRTPRSPSWHRSRLRLVHAFIPDIADAPYLTSTTALELADQPASLMVIGGGYIGCELAQMFATAGTKALARASPSFRAARDDRLGPVFKVTALSSSP